MITISSYKALMVRASFLPDNLYVAKDGLRDFIGLSFM